MSLCVMLAACVTVGAQTYNKPYYNTQPRTGYQRPYGSYGGGFFHVAQPDHYLGLRLGGAFTNVTSGYDKLKASSLAGGLYGGFVYGINVTPMTPLYIEFGLSYVEKGGKGKENGNKYAYNLNYIEIPLVLKYIYSPNNIFTIQPFFGAYMACGISGRITDYNGKDSYSSYISPNDGEPGFRRFDAGLKFGCGFGYNILYAELGYELGLANIARSELKNSAHDRALTLTVGVNF